MVLGILKKTLSIVKTGMTLPFPQKRERKSKNLGPHFANLQVLISRLYCKFDPSGKMGSSKAVTGEVDMKKELMLSGADPKEILRTAIDEQVPVIMSYLSKGKWHVAKVLLTNLEADTLNIECTGQRAKPHPVNIQVNQPVGISFKYGYGKFVFDTTITALEQSSDLTSGGKIVLAMPPRIEVVQRRSYFRVNVPESLKVNVVLWHRSRKHNAENEPHNYCRGRLVDISAGGGQVVIPNQSQTEANSSTAGKADFKKGQFIGMRFTPLPYEKPLMFNAQIRNVMPTENNESIYLGLQIVGLEASPEGRQVLARLVGVVERYYQINQSSAKQQEMQGASIP